MKAPRAAYLSGKLGPKRPCRQWPRVSGPPPVLKYCNLMQDAAMFTAETLAASVAEHAAPVRANETAPILVETAIARGEGRLSAHGACVAETGQFTGRSPKDKYIVRDAATEDLVWWDNAQAMTPTQFDVLLDDMRASLDGLELFSQQLYAGADTNHQLNVAVLTPSAWHALFIRNLLIRPE